MEVIDLVNEVKFTSDQWIVLLPVTCMLIDIITGLTNAWAHKEFKSSVMRIGLGHKVGETCALALGVILKFALGWTWADITASILICIMEGGSIYENFKKLGIKFDKSQLNQIVEIEKNKEDK